MQEELHRELKERSDSNLYLEEKLAQLQQNLFLVQSHAKEKEVLFVTIQEQLSSKEQEIIHVCDLLASKETDFAKLEVNFAPLTL